MKSSFEGGLFTAAVLAAITGELACFSRIVALVARGGSPLSVVLGTLVGNALLLLPILIWGEKLQPFLPETPVRYASAALFIGIGLWLLFTPHHAH